MPLSENEQKILDEIEQHLNTNDPRLVREAERATLPAYAARSLRWPLLGFVLCLGLVVATLQVHYILAFVAFMGMLLSALAMERHLRLIGRAGMDHLAEAIKTANPGPEERSNRPD